MYQSCKVSTDKIRKSENLKLYFLSRPDLLQDEVTLCAVVVASSEEDLVNIHSMGIPKGQDKKQDVETFMDMVDIFYLGKADSKVKEGVILSVTTPEVPKYVDIVP